MINFIKRIFKKEKQPLSDKKQKEIILKAGALFLTELQNSREFRRKIKNSSLGEKLQKIVKY